MLEGKKVNLRVLEKEDVSTLSEWVNDVRVSGAYAPMSQDTKAMIEKDWLESTTDRRWFAVEAKDGGKIGVIGHFPSLGCQEIGFAIIPGERGKGCCSDAAKVLVDFLFLSKDIHRVQATCDVDNEASRRVIEKAGLKMEGTLRNSMFINGRWRDRHIFSILRDEWVKPAAMDVPARKGQQRRATARRP